VPGVPGVRLVQLGVGGDRWRACWRGARCAALCAGPARADAGRGPTGPAAAAAPARDPRVEPPVVDEAPADG
jgi:hypothetical protein